MNFAFLRLKMNYDEIRKILRFLKIHKQVFFFDVLLVISANPNITHVQH